jgi:hypothetical protein
MSFIDRQYDIVCDIVYDVICDILYDVVMQDWLVPALEPEKAPGIITASEQIVKVYASKASLNAKQIKTLIEDVLRNPAFNAADVDTDMLKRFSAAIDMLKRFSAAIRNYFNASGRGYSSKTGII